MPERKVTNCNVYDLEYRLVGGQENATQISLQVRKLDRPFFNKDRFKVKNTFLRITKKNGEFCLTTAWNYDITPSPFQWPEGFLERHYNKLCLKVGQDM